MGFLNKLGIGVNIGTPRVSATPVSTNGRGSAAAARAPLPAVGATRMPESQSAARISNGLKEFLWNLDGLGRGTLLDMGAAWQTTLSFFIERGFRVTSDDLLRSWKDFLDAEQVELKKTDRFEDNVDRTPAGRASRFLESNLKYAPASFDAVLLWDLLDYLEPAVATQVVATMTEMLRPGGVVLAMFHTKKPEGFQRYRVMDSNTLQVISTPVLCQAIRVYQNREIQDLFGRYRTMKSFVGRDQLREALFIK
jgi:hypothetical protein